MRNPGNIGKSNTHKRHFTGPRIAVRGDRHVIPRLDAVLHVIPHLMRNPGNIGKGNTHKRRFSGPRIAVRGDPVLDAILHVIPRLDAVLHVIPRLDAVSRNTGKRMYRLPLTGPRIAVRGDTVLDAVSRKYPGGKYPAKAPQRNSPD